MINFNYESDFLLTNELSVSTWISRVIESEDKVEGDINFIFCDDAYLHSLNMQYLDHDTLTDVISFDYSENNIISGDVFISVERVGENASTYNVTFEDELNRVMIHGILHYCGYKDKLDNEVVTMRNKENEKIKMFHVEL